MREIASNKPQFKQGNDLQSRFFTLVNEPIGRRSAIRDGAAATIITIVAPTILAACAPTEKKSPMDFERAASIRQEIRDYENAHPNEVNEKTLTKIFELTTQLYETTFNKKAAPTQLIALASEVAEKDSDKKYDQPEGFAGLGLPNPNKTTAKDFPFTYPVALILGRPEYADPSINRLSVMRALIAHEFIHTQVKVGINPETAKINGKEFTAQRKKGLKWMNVPGATPKGEKGYLSEELHTQLIAEYMNDPSGQDDIFRLMNKSPIYRKSLAPNYVSGAAILREMYSKLCISIHDIEEYHFESAPKIWMTKVDEAFAARGIKPVESPSSYIIGIEEPDSYSEVSFEKVRGLIKTL